MYPFLRLMRLDKPIGTLLVLWPVLWALWLANQGLPSLKLLLIFISGALIMRSAGCVINDIFDRQLDKHVARTLNRPLALGEIPLKQAWFTFFSLLLLALILVLQLNALTILIAVLAVPLVIVYPLCKRITYLPQCVLGLTFNMGVLMAYAASINQLPPMAWYLFFLSVIWTVAYDTLYAMLDQADDIKVGIKSTAVLFGQYALLIIYVLYALFFIGFLGLGLMSHLGNLFVIFVLLSAIWTYCNLVKMPPLSHISYLTAFLANNITGMLIFLGIFCAFIH